MHSENLNTAMHILQIQNGTAVYNFGHIYRFEFGLISIKNSYNTKRFKPFEIKLATYVYQKLALLSKFSFDHTILKNKTDHKYTFDS